jgi:hypothetical protein
LDDLGGRRPDRRDRRQRAPGPGAGAGALAIRRPPTLILRRATGDDPAVQGAHPQAERQEASKDVPSWARGKYPYVGENGKGYAERLMDDQYGRGNWSRTGKEYKRLQKYGDRNFRNPRSMLLPDDDHI